MERGERLTFNDERLAMSDERGWRCTKLINQ